MLENLNIKISKVKEDLRRKKKLESMLEKCKEELYEQEIKMEDLNRILKKEEKDVKKLESLSITGLFYSVLGTKEEKLDKEKEEYIAARLKYEECHSVIKDLKQEINNYKKELERYSSIDSDYSILMKEKENLMISNNDHNSLKLTQIADKISDLESDIKEIKEAIMAGNNAKTALEDVIDTLEDAKSWGMWDALGGGFLATVAKHSKIDKAKEQTHYAQKMISVFNRELSDVDLSTNINIEVGSFATFADYFFDGIMVDWFVQGKIRDSLLKVEDTYDSINSLLDRLQGRLRDSSKKLDLVKEEMRILIEGA